MSQFLLLLRSLLFTLLMVVATIIWAPLCFLSAPLSYNKRYYWTSRWNVFVIWAAKVICGIHYQIKGLENLPDNELLKQMQADVANKRKVKTDRYPETWYNFFPEDLLKSHLVRGRRGVQPMMPQPRFGARMAPRR